MRLLRRFAPRNDGRRGVPLLFVIARHVENMSWQSHSIIPTFLSLYFNKLITANHYSGNFLLIFLQYLFLTKNY